MRLLLNNAHVATYNSYSLMQKRHWHSSSGLHRRRVTTVPGAVGETSSQGSAGDAMRVRFAWAKFHTKYVFHCN